MTEALVAPTKSFAAAAACTLTGPATVDVYRQVTYDLTVNKDPGAEEKVTIKLDSGLSLIESTIAASAAGPVTSFTYDAGTNVLVLTYAAAAQASQVSFATSMRDVNKVDSSTSYKTSVSGCSTNSDTVTTKVQGDLGYGVSKTEYVSPGSDGRTVRYSFNVGTNNWVTGTKTFTNWGQSLVDVMHQRDVGGEAVRVEIAEY